MILQKIQDLMFPPIPPQYWSGGTCSLSSKGQRKRKPGGAIRQVIHRQHGHGNFPFRDLSFGWFPLFFNQIQHPWFRSSKGNISTIIVIVVWDTTCSRNHLQRQGVWRPSIHLKGYMPHMCWTHSGFIGLILHLEVVTTNPIWPWKHIPLMSCTTWSFSIDTCLQQNFQRSWGIGIRISIARRTESTISMYHHFKWW